jgi:branched-chain amino acid transport system permease protein
VHTGLFYWSISANALMWAFFGGLGSLIGPVLGVTILLPFESFMSPLVGYPRLFTGVVLMIIVLVHRGGVVGALSAIAERLKPRRATLPG